MDEKQLIEKWLERNRYDITAGLEICGEWLPLRSFKRKLDRELFRTLLVDWNGQRGTTARKPIENFFSIAKERSIPILTDYYQAEVDRRGYVLVNLFQEGGLIVEISGRLYYYYKFQNKRYLQPFDLDEFLDHDHYHSHRTYLCTMAAPDVFEFLDYYSGVIDMAVKMWKQLEFSIRKQIDLAELSLSIIESYLLRSLAGRNIRYFVKVELATVNVYVKIADRLWYKGPVSMESIENFAQLVPMAVMHPEDRNVLGPDFNVINDIFAGYDHQCSVYWESKGMPQQGV